MTAIADLLSPEQRERILERLAALADLADVMREPPRPSGREDDQADDATAAAERAAS